MVTIAQLDPLLADFHVSPEMAGSLEAGSRVVVTTPQGAVEGEITVISPIINAQSNTVVVRVTLPNDSGALISGSRVTYNPIINVEKSSNEQGQPASTEAD